MRLAVVGCGYWGSKHVRVLHSISEIEQVIVVDPRAERLKELKRDFPAIGTFERLEEALDHVDAVIVATPPDTHARLAMMALHAGKSVLVQRVVGEGNLITVSGASLANRLPRQ